MQVHPIPIWTFLVQTTMARIIDAFSGIRMLSSIANSK